MGACSPASWELSVTSSCSFVEAGYLAPWELTSSLAAGSVAAGSLASRERLPGSMGAYRYVYVQSLWQPTPRLRGSFRRIFAAGFMGAGSPAP